jgi:hypothetical protein
LDASRGVISLMMVAPNGQQDHIASELIGRAEQYLAANRVLECYAGCCSGFSPYYLGIYGGSGTPGVLSTDAVSLNAFQSRQYASVERRVVFQRDLAAFRAPVDRQLIELKRKLQLEFVSDGMPSDWWEAVTFSHIDRLQCRVGPRGGQPWAWVEFWDVEPLASAWGVHAVGFLGLTIADHVKDADPVVLKTFVLAETFRSVQSQGITLAEIQTLSDDRVMIDICKRLGFGEVVQGISLKRTLNNGATDAGSPTGQAGV